MLVICKAMYLSAVKLNPRMRPLERSHPYIGSVEICVARLQRTARRRELVNHPLGNRPGLETLNGHRA
jgi:hypothetical protein